VNYSATLPRLLLPLGLLLAVLGAKFGLIQHAGSDLPYHDQWAAEGSVVYRWYLHGALHPSYLFWAHGEHTPALTRALGLGLFVLNGNQWDALVESTACVLLYGLVVMVLWRFTREILGERARALAAAGATALFIQPVCSENFVWGFQTQFHFLLLFGLAHLFGTLREERTGISWAVGQLAGALALFSIASGVLSALVLAGFALHRLWSEPRNRWAWATLLVNGSLAVAGFWLIDRAYDTAGAKAGSPWEFLKAFGNLLSWPLPGAGWFILLQLPLGWFCYRAWNRAGRAWHLLMALGVWAWLLAAALAYGRGYGTGMIASRYLDLLLMGLFANLLAGLWLWCHGGLSRMARLVLAASLVAQLAGLAWQNRPEIIRAGLNGIREQQERQRGVLKEFLATNDPAILERDASVRRVLPHFDLTVELLTDPIMREALPPSLAPGLSVSPKHSAGGMVRLHPGEHYESPPVLSAGRPIWRMRVRGLLGAGQGEVFVLGSDGREYRSGSGNNTLPEQARTIHLPAPPQGARLVARAGDRGPLEFSEPVELGYLSWYAPKLAGAWAGLLVAGGVVLMAGIGAVFLRPAGPKP
jgi:hypothetical protein